MVTQYFWPESFRINDLVCGLVDKGHEVVLLTGIPNYPKGKYLEGYGFFGPFLDNFNGIPVYRVPMFARGEAGMIGLSLNYLSFVFFACLLAPFRVGKNFDLIFVFEPSPITVGLPAILLRWLHKKPLMFWVQDLWPESLSATGMVTSPRLLRKVERLVRFIYRRCDRILVQSEGFVPRVVAVGGAKERVLYFPNWAEPLYRVLRLERNAPERGEVPRGFCVMFAGNIGAAQSFDTILDAMQRLRDYADIHCVILGDGHQRTWVEEQVAERGLRDQVHLLGRRPMEAMPRYFALADALLVTLRRAPVFALTIPSKVQSYLACARPIVASLDGEGRKVIEASGSGVAVPAGDAVALAGAILKLYRMSETERVRMGANGRAYFERNFERDMLLQRLERWMQESAREGLCAS